MRQLVFVLVLVGAAFAGGAALNGPGLTWIRHNVIGGAMIVDTAGARPPKRFPAANPPLAVDLSPRPLPPSSGRPAPVAAPAPVAEAEAGGFNPAAAVRPIPQTPSLPAPPVLAADAPLELPGDPAPAGPAASPGPDPAAKVDPTARLASTAAADASAPNPAAGDPNRDWADVRERLKALGVTRYTVDADLSGRVRFSCVIPVDGLRAVGHHFEAEGDDEFQAAEAAVRRVTLWRATEPTRTGP